MNFGWSHKFKNEELKYISIRVVNENRGIKMKNECYNIGIFESAA